MYFQKLKQPAYLFRDTRMGGHSKSVIKIAVVLLVLLSYDTLLDISVHLVHTLFESTELLLDSAIEDFFDTTRKKTQIIVFYILATIIFAGAFKVYLNLPRWYQTCKNKLFTYLQQQKHALVLYWHEMPVMSKVKAWTILLSLLLYFWFFGF